MNPGMIGLVGGIVGGVIGLLGGAAGTYFSIKNTQTKAEQRFITRCSVVVWVLTLALIVAPITLDLLGIIPSWLSRVLWAIYMIVTLGSIPWLNRRAVLLHQSPQST